MVRSQQRNRLLDHVNGCVVLAEPQVMEYRLQQLDADPPVLGVEHHAQNAVAPQAIGECLDAAAGSAR